MDLDLSRRLRRFYWLGYGSREVVVEAADRLEKLATSPTTRLHNLCDGLSEDADESPFTREEWERIDKQTVEHIRQMALMRAALNRIGDLSESFRPYVKGVLQQVDSPDSASREQEQT